MDSSRRPSSARLLLGAVGVLGIGYGAFRLLSQPERSHPATLLVWLAVAVAVHDGLLVPLTLALGTALSAVLPVRGRRYVQGALVASGLVTAVALPLVERRGSAVAVKALEDQDYLGHLLLLVGIIAAGAAAAFALEVVRERRRAAAAGTADGLARED